MKTLCGIAVLAAAMFAGCSALSTKDGETSMFDRDTIRTSNGDLGITFIGHGSLMFDYGGKTIYVDPVKNIPEHPDYSNMPKADIILVTHEHSDHCDPKTIAELSKKGTILLLTKKCKELVKSGIVIGNGESTEVDGIGIEAVPAYNLVHKRPDGQPFHPKGQGNGYVITFGDKRVYVAGDTENVPVMKNLKNIDIAFLPMNLPYTMTPEMAADAAMMFKPGILYPYHFGNTDTSKLVKLLADEKGIEVRIRKME